MIDKDQVCLTPKVEADTEIHLLSLEDRICSLNNSRDVLFARIVELQGQVETLESSITS